VAGVYTTRFVGHKGLSSAAPTGYIVPPGHVAVVRDADVYIGGPLLGTEQIFLQLLPDGWTFVEWHVQSSPNAFSGHWEGRAVFNELEEFGFLSNVGTWDVQCTGYLFATP